MLKGRRDRAVGREMGGVDDVEIVQSAALRRDDVAARVIVELACDLTVRLVRTSRQHRHAAFVGRRMGIERLHTPPAVDIRLVRDLERI